LLDDLQEELVVSRRKRIHFCLLLSPHTRAHTCAYQDLGPNVKVLPTHYTLKYGSSANYCVPRHWALQGANDPAVETSVRKKEAKLEALPFVVVGFLAHSFPPLFFLSFKDAEHLWTTIRLHENDTSMNRDYHWVIYRLDNCNSAFRYFRVIQLGPNAYMQNQPNPGTSDVWSQVFVVTGFEMYGLCIKV
jgi:hypothetical protein